MTFNEDDKEIGFFKTKLLNKGENKDLTVVRLYDIKALIIFSQSHFLGLGKFPEDSEEFKKAKSHVQEFLTKIENLTINTKSGPCYFSEEINVTTPASSDSPNPASAYQQVNP